VGPGAGTDVLEKRNSLAHIYTAYSIISVVGHKLQNNMKIFACEGKR
jgi:hypothetical protein